MSGYPTGLIVRMWKVLQSGELKGISPKLSIKAEKPLSEFFLDMLASPAVQALQDSGTAINDDEFLVYVASEEDGPLDCIVTNRKLIFFAERDPVTKGGRAEAKEHGPRLEARSCLFASATSVKTGPAGHSAKVTIERKRGNPLTLNLSTEASGAAIRFAAERFGQHWDSLQGAGPAQEELESALEKPDFAAAAEEAASKRQGSGPVAASVKVKTWTRKALSDQVRGNPPRTEQEEDTIGSALADLVPFFVGFVVFVIFLMANGAPIFEGGPAVMHWLGRGNSGYLYGAIAAGALAAFFWSRERKKKSRR